MAEATKLRYIGPFRSLDVPGLGTVQRNHQIPVEDATLAQSLLDQADWEEVGNPKPKGAAAEAEEDKVVTGG